MKKNHLFKLTTLGFLAMLIIAGDRAWSLDEGMANMPLLKPKRSYTVQNTESGERLLEQRGYGDQEPMVRMMNLMMVGGSGYEGMDMGEMVADAKTAQPSHAHEGHAKEASTSTPSPTEGQTAAYDLNVQITPDPPQVGANNLVIAAQKKNDSKPAKNLKLKTQVYMTSMDMGTEEPKVREISAGKYQVKVVFSMKGPWAVKIILPEGGEKVFDFNVGAGSHH